MVSILDNFEKKLQNLDELVMPVYETSNELRLLLGNVDASTVLVDSITHYYNIYNQLASTISFGPDGNLLDYLSEMDRLDDAAKYLKRVKAENESERVMQLFNIGRKKLVEESERLIARYANPLSPKDLLQLYPSAGTETNDFHEMQGALRVARLLVHRSIEQYLQRLI
jgi:hypothetical protein